jgi:small nuclear ribonucleoprotein (snRNP)-like protein
MRVTLSDGRVIVGRFYCLDRERNVVLTEAYTQLPAPATPSSPAAAAAAAAAAAPAVPAMTAAEVAAAEEASLAARFLGVVMVPGRHLVKAEVEEPDAAAAAAATAAARAS